MMGYAMRGACYLPKVTARHLRDVLRFQLWADKARSPALSPAYTLVVLDNQYYQAELNDASIMDVLREIRNHPRMTLACLFKHGQDVPQQLLDADIFITGTHYRYSFFRLFGYWASPAACRVACQLFRVGKAFPVRTPRGLHQLPVGDQTESRYKPLLLNLTDQPLHEQTALFTTNNHAIHTHHRTCKVNEMYAGRDIPTWIRMPPLQPTILQCEQVEWLHRSGYWSPNEVASTQQQVGWIDEWYVRKAAIHIRLLGLEGRHGQSLLPLVLADLICEY
jgi:hypothetical protein